MERDFEINETLIWDYDFKDKLGTEEFKKWYISCVLTRGTTEDIRKIGFKTIKENLLSLNLPKRIREFWEWYFNYAGFNQTSGEVT